LEDRDIEFSIVSGSSEDMLFGCVDSLIETMKGSTMSWRAVITCNTSDQALAGKLRDRYPGANIIQNSSPRGFAANHNSVLKDSRARYVWLLNDDLLILPGAVEKVTAFMEQSVNARVAAVSPKLLNPDGSLQPSTYSFPSMPQLLLAHSGLRELAPVEAVVKRVAHVMRRAPGTSRYWAHDRTIEVDTLRGACVAMRMKAVREVGLMSEAALVGGEETEWHRRFKEHEWKVVYFPEASVIHYGSQTVREGSNNHYPEYLKGALFFFRTGRGRAAYSLFCASLVAMFGVRTAIAWIARNRNEVGVSKRYAAVAWDGLRGKVS
jgi:GT2 family glycosyltransferase